MTKIPRAPIEIEIAQLKDVIAKHPNWGRRRIASHLGWPDVKTREYMAKLKSPEAVEEPKESLSFQESGDTGEASSLSRKIRTLDDLLSYAKVDLEIWEVERHIVNKWDMGYKDNETQEAHSHPLYQIKAWLRRKVAIVRTVQDLLKEMSAKAPVFPRVARPKRRPSAPKRSLEVCIMDPHVGLLCSYPEADAPWDLEIAAGMIMQAIDDLVAKAEAFGPFCEVFMPFGNDFVHCDTVDHTTTAGTPQPESIAYHKVYKVAADIAIAMVHRLRKVAPIKIYEVPGNHSRVADFTLSMLLDAYFRHDKDVTVDCSSSPYKFHKAGVNLIGYEHGHSVKPIRLAALMANECRDIWHLTEYREWHLGDQHRKGSSNPATLEEQGVSVEYIPGLTAPNEWHRLKSFSHQKRGAMAYVWDWAQGPIGRFQFNISQYSHKALE